MCRKHLPLPTTTKCRAVDAQGAIDLAQVELLTSQQARMLPTKGQPPLQLVEGSSTEALQQGLSSVHGRAPDSGCAALGTQVTCRLHVAEVLRAW